VQLFALPNNVEDKVWKSKGTKKPKRKIKEMEKDDLGFEPQN